MVALCVLNNDDIMTVMKNKFRVEVFGSKIAKTELYFSKTTP